MGRVSPRGPYKSGSTPSHKPSPRSRCGRPFPIRLSHLAALLLHLSLPLASASPLPPFPPPTANLDAGADDEDGYPVPGRAQRRRGLLLTAGVGCPSSTTGDDSAASAPPACSVCGGSRGSGLGGFQSPLPHNRIQNPVLEFFYLPFQNFLFWHPR
ncbi:hypothetical protein ABZP36_022052 [Zizania latifolia]